MQAWTMGTGPCWLHLDCSDAALAFADASNYFADQETKMDVHSLENFQAFHADQMARDELPCQSDPALKLQCASVSRAAKTAGRRKFKVADEQHSNKLFDEAYRPGDSRHFDVARSNTFVPQSTQTFDLNYADGSHLRGFSGVDQVYMGNYKATSPFGVITDCNSPGGPSSPSLFIHPISPPPPPPSLPPSLAPSSNPAFPPQTPPSVQHYPSATPIPPLVTSDTIIPSPANRRLQRRRRHPRLRSPQGRQ